MGVMFICLEVITINQTTLYNLEPIDLGKGSVESLSSYLIRLAEAHSLTVGKLVGRKVAVVLNKAYLIKSENEGGNRFYEVAYEINGLGSLAKNWAQALVVLTGRKRLEELTLIRFNEWLPDRGLLRSHLAWCPACLEEWKEGNKEVYEPLLWNFKVVTNCMIHQTQLETECPNCLGTIQVLSRKRRIGYCSRCGTWLGRLELHREITSDEHLKWQLFVIQNVQELLAISSRIIVELSNAHITAATKDMVNSFGSKRAFSKEMGIPETTVRAWFDGKHRPSLESLLKICYSSDLRLVDLVSGKNEGVNYSSRIMSGDKGQIRATRRHFDSQHMLNMLLGYLNDKSLSMREVARRLDFDQKVLYNHFPDVCKAIAHGHRLWIQKKRQIRIDASCKLVREATISLLDQGIYPSRRKIESILPPAISLREKMLQNTWKEALLEFITKNELKNGNN